MIHFQAFIIIVLLMIKTSMGFEDDNDIGDKSILIVLSFVITFCLIENLFLMLLTVTRLNNKCRLLKEFHLFNQSSNSNVISTRRQSEITMVDNKQIRNSIDITNDELDGFDNCIFCGQDIDKKVTLKPKISKKKLLCWNVEREWLMHPNSAFGRFTRYYFGNLCFANLVLALFALPSTLIVSLNIGFPATNETSESIHPKFSINGCTVIEYSVTTLVMAMIVCLVQLTFDRLLAIIKPLHYDRIMNKKKAILFIVLGWVFCLMANSIPDLIIRLQSSDNSTEEIHQNTNEVLSHTELSKCFYLGQHDETGGHKYTVFLYFSLVYLLPIIFMITAYAKLYATARRLSIGVNITTTYSIENGNSLGLKHFSMLNRLLCCSKSHVNIDGNINGQLKKLPKRKLTSTMGEAKATLRAFWLVLTFSSLTFPYFFIMLSSEIISRETQFQDDETKKKYQHYMDYLRNAGMFLLYVNAIVTPMVYAYKDRVLRARFCSVFFNSSQFQDGDGEETSISKSQSRICSKCQSNPSGRKRPRLNSTLPL